MRIRNKILLSTFLIIIVVLSVFTFAYMYLAGDALEKKTTKNIDLLCQSYARQINTRLESYIKGVDDLSSAIITGIYVPDVLKEKSRIHSDFKKIFYTYTDGRIINNYPPNRGHKYLNLKGKPYWQRVHKDISPYISEVNKDFGFYGIVVSSPVVSNYTGERIFHGIISVAIPIENVFRKIINTNTLEIGEIFIIDSKKRYIFHNDKNKILKRIGKLSDNGLLKKINGENSGRGWYSFKGKRRYISFYPVKKSRWTLAISVRESVLNHDMENLLIFLVVTFIICIAAMVIVVNTIVRRIVSPITETVNILREAAKGEDKLEFDNLKIDSHDEMGDISNYFKKIVKNLQRITDELSVNLLKERREKIKVADKLEQSEKRFKSIVDQSPFPIRIISKNGENEYLNPKFTEVFGYTKEDVPDTGTWIKKAFNSFNNNDDKISKWERLPDKRMDDEIFKDTYNLRCKDGRELVIISTLVNMKDGSYFCIYQNITEQKKAERSLNRLNIELEDRVKRRTEELENSNQILYKSMEKLKQTQEQLIESEKMAALGSLVAGVAHEINTPIGIGVTAGSFLKSKTEEINSAYIKGELTREGLEKYLLKSISSSELILKNLKRAAELIRSFKKVAVDQTNEQKRRFNLLEYVNDVLTSMRTYLKKSGHKIKLKISPDIELDSFPGIFVQILTNFITNSLNHGFSDRFNGEIIIEAVREENELVLIYSDNGNGMTEDVLKRIFEPFFTTKRSAGGTGLGMHIVYNLVNRNLKGTIKCDSKPGSGTTFIIRIP